MEHRGDFEAARRRYPVGSRVQIITGWYKGDQAVVREVDEAAFHELGEVVLWLDPDRPARVPASLLQHEVIPV
ncbi:MAG TPA: KOW motif-containing protein [Pseudonocardiaceae bacterium]